MKTVIIGLGNTILSDDGIGIYIVRELTNDFKDIEFIETSTSGFYLLDHIAGYQRGIFIDSIKTEKGEPGEVNIYKLENFKKQRSFSLHSTDLISAIEHSKRCGIDIPGIEQIYFIAIEIIDNQTFSESLTKEIETKKEVIYNEVKKKVSKIIFGKGNEE